MRRFLVAGLVVAVVPVGLAFAGSTGLKVTGGGQVIVDAQGGGPGDTIAFTAQQTSTTPIAGGDRGFPAKGQLQVQDRQLGNGQAKVRFHGIVTCIREYTDDNNTQDTSDDQDYIRFGGNKKVGSAGTLAQFTVDAQDNGEGLSATGSDMMFFRQRNSGTPCDTTDTATDLRTSSLARGNVQEH